MLPKTQLNARALIGIVKRRWWLAVIPPLVTTFTALLIASTVPNSYRSDMLIAIDPQRVPDSFVRSTVTLQAERRVDAITVQVLSRTALEELITSLDLYAEDRKSKSMEEIVGKMRAAIDVELERPRNQRSGQTEVTAFHVRFTYTDPEMAAKVTQILGSRFIEQNVKDRSELAGAANRFLEQQLVEARKKLESQEQLLESFRQKHGAELPTQMQTNLQAIQTKQLQVQALVESIARERDRKLMLERLYREALSEPPAAAPVVQNRGGAAATESVSQQLVAARAALEALRTKYTDDHPDVVIGERKVRELEEKARLAAPAPGNTETRVAEQDPVRREALRQMAAEVESLDRLTSFKEAEERRLRAEISEYQRRIEAVPGLESEFAALTRDYDTQQTAYRELLAKSTAAKVSEDLEQQEIGERFRIVDTAAVPVEPLESPRLRYNLGGLALGLVLGFSVLAFLEARDASFRTEAEVIDLLALPVLAMVPQIESPAEHLKRKRRRTMAMVAGTVALGSAAYLWWSLELWKSLV